MLLARLAARAGIDSFSVRVVWRPFRLCERDKELLGASSGCSPVCMLSDRGTSGACRVGGLEVSLPFSGTSGACRVGGLEVSLPLPGTGLRAGTLATGVGTCVGGVVIFESDLSVGSTIAEAAS